MIYEPKLTAGYYDLSSLMKTKGHDNLATFERYYEVVIGLEVTTGETKPFFNAVKIIKVPEYLKNDRGII